ncbi:hypothetical protein V6N13_032108 [Hibiscus sabdariffa]|uniref:Uncharacterized protein n=1 Tax=Hibiscus sabdariffa TaxID=183260 RepID=A0ABR2B617_9ROSI
MGAEPAATRPAVTGTLEAATSEAAGAGPTGAETGTEAAASEATGAGTDAAAAEAEAGGEEATEGAGERGGTSASFTTETRPWGLREPPRTVHTEPARGALAAQRQTAQGALVAHPWERESPRTEGLSRGGTRSRKTQPGGLVRIRLPSEPPWQCTPGCGSRHRPRDRARAARTTVHHEPNQACSDAQQGNAQAVQHPPATNQTIVGGNCAKRNGARPKRPRKHTMPSPGARQGRGWSRPPKHRHKGNRKRDRISANGRSKFAKERIKRRRPKSVNNSAANNIETPTEIRRAWLRNNHKASQGNRQRKPASPKSTNNAANGVGTPAEPGSTWQRNRSWPHRASTLREGVTNQHHANHKRNHISF